MKQRHLTPAAIVSMRLKWFVKIEVICVGTLLQVTLYADLFTNRIFPNNDSLCTWHAVCGILELAVVWAARWGEGRGLWVAHFAV